MAGVLAAVKRGSALALPLLLLVSAAPAAGLLPSAPQEAAHLDGGVRGLYTSAGSLDTAAGLVGAPSVGGTWWLAGGGATLTKPELRVAVAGWEGALQAQQGGNSADWQLQLAELIAEQSYPKGPFLITAGFSGEHGQLYGSLVGPAGRSGVHVPLWGGGITAGVRWPRGTQLGFLFRSHYLWLSGQGDWQGDQAGLLGAQRFDLGGPGMTGQLELSF